MAGIDRIGSRQSFTHINLSKVFSMARTISLFIVFFLATFMVVAHAHENTHGRKKPAAVRKEQKDWGIAGDAKSVKRTINISMTDQMRFVPSKIAVKLGETVRFVLKNEGKMLHEMVIGTKQELEAHAALMLKFPDMEHDEPYMVHVPVGKRGEIVWAFNRAGNFDFACLIPGHYQAGMIGTIAVAAK
jgi:uncharacterized cupredoxin-like copper-binding protein